MTQTDKWENLDWFEIEREVFQTQMRIFRKSRENRSSDVHSLQKLLTGSRSARCLAVRKAAEDSRGSNTPGVDGVAALTAAQKLRLASELSLHQRPQPVRRTNIPKPGSQELRPLGIPTISDRALQHLIVLALDPEWEAKYSPHMYGFRRGRGCHDALIDIRAQIQRCPKWVLDADIEKFFDRLDHQAILKKLDTWPQMETVIRRFLNSGVVIDAELTSTDSGTPQGGPLSPLLANVALTGLETDIERAFPAKSKIGEVCLRTSPRPMLYADDIRILHEHREVVEAVKSFIEHWLQPLGLNLKEGKTRIAHTLDKVDGRQAGFNFLGCRVQQFRVGNHSVKPYFKGIWTHISPSEKAVKTLLQKCRESIEKMGPHKKRNAVYQQRLAAGKAGPLEIMTIHLNKSIRGWCGYHRHHNSKKTFSRIDHDLFWMLWRWAKRTFPRQGRKRLVKELFKRGNKWGFGVSKGATGMPVNLLKAADVKIERHFPVQTSRSFYDGDWAYWATRTGRYPGLPRSVGRLLKRQKGKCSVCHEKITVADRALVAQGATGKEGAPTGGMVLLHEHCDDKLDKGMVRKNPFLVSR